MRFLFLVLVVLILFISGCSGATLMIKPDLEDTYRQGVRDGIKKCQGAKKIQRAEIPEEMKGGFNFVGN